jgi:hypothetical protein
MRHRFEMRVVCTTALAASVAIVAIPWPSGSAHHRNHEKKVIIRHQTGSEWTQMLGAAGGYQVGLATYSEGKSVPVYWHGDMNDGTQANSGGYFYAQMFATDGKTAGGRATNNAASPVPLPWHAMLWTDVTQPPIDLHPKHFVASEISCVSGEWQGGFGRRGESFITHPLLWDGSPGSAVDLLPAGAAQGHIHAMVSGAQFGSVQLSLKSPVRAAMWHGSPASFQDVTPNGYDSAAISGAQGDQEVGWGLPAGMSSTPTNFQGQALLWSGSDVINLHPSAFYYSEALATDCAHQVGFVSGQAEDTERACMWSGSADSFFDLHALLPDGYITSWATGVDGNIVSGYAWRKGNKQIDAIIWEL